MRRRQLIYYLLLLILTHPVFTGKPESEISVSVQQLADTLRVSCCLMGDDKVSQINWVLTRGTDSTKLGTYHPNFGVHIFPEFNGSVAMEGSAAERTSHVHLTRGGVEESGTEVCCIFYTFPSGVQKNCTVTEITGVEARLTEPEQEMGTVYQWCFLLGGFSICLTSITISLYCCWKHCCRFCCWRRRVYEVQTYLTDCSTDSEGPPPAVPLPERPPPPLPLPPPKGFDPTRLYAKIKLDLLYGRLWKAYQGTARVWAPAAPQQETPQKVYSLLGELGPVQVRERPVESGPAKPQLDPASLFVCDFESLSNHTQSSPKSDYDPECDPTASLPESPNPLSEPQSDCVTLDDSMFKPDPAEKT